MNKNSKIHKDNKKHQKIFLKQYLLDVFFMSRKNIFYYFNSTSTRLYYFKA